MERYVRDVEKIIDSHHKSNPLFSLDRKTALFNALTVFEDFCRLGGMNTLLSGDPIQHGLFVRDQLDAINVLIEWIFCSCPNKPEVPLDTHIDDSRMLNVAQVFELFAKPYAALCSAYISYSRKMFSASVDKEQKTICFHENQDNKEIVISDLMESIHRDQGFSINDLQNQQQEEAFRRLVSSINTSSGRIVYCTDDTIWVPFRKIMKNQWVSTSELPDEWEFDSFSIGEFKEVWISLATLCLIHTTACLQSNAPGLCVDEVLLVKSPEEFASFINQKSRISIDRVLSIISLLTYDNGLNKNDIIYQPFVEIEHNKLALAPHLILSSRPERNLVSLISKKGDKAYFSLTNMREELMRKEISAMIEEIPEISFAHNKVLPGELPDVDFAIWDHQSNRILICELKWLVEPDSTPEVFSRAEDLEHGCNQVSDMLDYAHENVEEFCKRVFNLSTQGLSPTIEGCVLSKKGIRVEHNKIPVISMKSFHDLVNNTSTFSQVIDKIVNKEYLLPTCFDFYFDTRVVEYAGYIFKIPSLIRQKQDIPLITSKKVGRNEKCPCGSGLKYKKCCGKSKKN